MEGDAPDKTLHATDRAAMRTLANNRSVRGMTAIRFAGATTTTEATHSWTGRGANYTAWVGALRRDPTIPEAAIHQDAPERVYLAIMNGAKHSEFDLSLDICASTISPKSTRAACDSAGRKHRLSTPHVPVEGLHNRRWELRKMIWD